MIDGVTPPVAIGGVGGSGTRLVARLLMEAGFFLGSDLNGSNDNLWFTLLFKRPEILSATDREFGELLQIFVDRMTGGGTCTPSQSAMVRRLASDDRLDHPAEWLAARADSLLASGASAGPQRAWGWKEPNTHIVIDRLIRLLPGMKYIHVVRNGLDMAYSTNQNQLRLWGPHFLGNHFDVSPFWSLKYWHVVHERLLRLCAPMGERFLLLNYDRMCLDPENEISRLLGFLGWDKAGSRFDIERLFRLVEVPASIGRFRREGTAVFDPADTAFARQLGFDIDRNTGSSI